MRVRCLTIVAVLVSLALGAHTDATAARVRWDGNGHWYEAVSLPSFISWYTANDYATARGGYLATITTQMENDFVFSLIDSAQYWGYCVPGSCLGPWIGAYQPPGSPEPGGNWQWVTGEPFLYTAWASGEPTNCGPGGEEDRIFYYNNTGAAAPSRLWNDYNGWGTLPNSLVVEYDGAEAANLSLMKSGPADTVRPGDAIQYDLTVTNMGPDEATNVTLVDDLPVGMAFVAAVASNDGTCAEAGGTVTCELGTIAVGDSVSVLLQGILTAVNVSNTASVTSSAFDPITGNNIGTAMTQVACGHSSAVSEESQSDALPVLRQSVPNPLNSGTVIVFTRDRPSWSQTDITDPALPHTADSVIFDWYDRYAPSNASDNTLGLVGSWHSGDWRTGEPFPHWVQIDFGTPRTVTQLNVLAYSESFDDYLRLKDFRFEGSNDGVNYTPLHQDVLQYANRHEWQSFFFQDFTGYRYYRLYGLDNWGCYDYCNQMIIEEWEMLGYEGAQSANLSVAKTGPADTVHVGDIVDYDLMVTNMGPGDAMNVVLVDNLPAGMAFVAAVPSNDGTCTEAGGTVTCELGTIAVGDSVSVSIQGMLAAVAVSNKASVTSSAFDVSTGNNTATAVTQVACGQSSAVSDEPQSEAVPMLGQSVPNPLNSGTVIVFTLPSESKVALSVYDVGGRRVRALFEGRRAAGEHRMTWDGRDDAGHLVASGIYFYDLRVADRVQGRRKALVLR